MKFSISNQILYYLSTIRQTTPRIRFISLEPSLRIRLKDIRKCPAQSYHHEKIKPPALRKNTQKTWFDRPKNKTRKRRFHTDLLDFTWSREGKLVR